MTLYPWTNVTACPCGQTFKNKKVKKKCLYGWVFLHPKTVHVDPKVSIQTPFTFLFLLTARKSRRKPWSGITQPTNFLWLVVYRFCLYCKYKGKQNIGSSI